LTEDKCYRCTNKFYLEDGNCKGHDDILDCDIFHHAVKNICIDCNNESFLFTKQNDCLMASNVEECNIYNNNDECIGCKDGFFLKNDLCVEIATEYNCR